MRRLVSSIEQGWSPQAEGRQTSEAEWGVIKLSAVSKGKFRSEEHKAFPEDVDPDRRYEIREGDLLLTRANTPDLVGDACVARDVRPGLMLCDLVYRLDVCEERVDPTFLAYWLLSTEGRHQISVDARGSSSSMVKVAQGHIRSWLAPVPPLVEQHAIAAFLDRETAEIDALLADKARLIEVLREERTALISHAVTKGLDPTAPLADSGIEWLGEIPAHWKVKRLKFLLESMEQGWSPQCEARPADAEEWGVLKVGCVNGGVFNSDENKALPPDLSPEVRYEISLGDVLISRANTKELLRSAARVPVVRPGLMLCDKLYRLRLNEDVDPGFLVLALGAAPTRYQFERDSTGSSDSMQNISQESVKNTVLPLPPKEEQVTIAKHVERETAEIDALLSDLRAEVERLQEYRTALISAAVTGKIDVRGEAA